MSGILQRNHRGEASAWTSRALAPIVALTLAAPPVRAQVTPGQATALESQLTEWLRAIGGKDAKLPPRPVEITPEGDHFAVRIPLNEFGLKDIDPANAAFTARAQPLGGTRYRITNQQFPPALAFTVSRPLPPAPGHGPAGTEDVRYHVAVGAQDQSATIDTAFASPTTGSGTVASIDITSTDSIGAHATHFSNLTTQTSATPADPAHIDILGDSSAKNFFSKTESPNGDDITISADSLHITQALTGVSHDRVLPVVQALMAFARLPQGDPKDMTPAQRAALRTVLLAAKDLLTGSKLDESLDGIKFGVGGQAGAIHHVELSFSGTAPADKLSATFGMVIDGLVIDSLPPQFAALVPTHLAFRPTVSNVNLAVLTREALEQTSPKPPPSTDSMNAMFAAGGIQFGFDQLAIDMAGAKLRGTGQFTAAGPGAVSGTANITAHGLDDLIARAQTDPALQTALPVAIFLKGIAKVNGDEAVWQVTVGDGRALVNGVDMSAMMGGGPKPH